MKETRTIPGAVGLLSIALSLGAIQGGSASQAQGIPALVTDQKGQTVWTSASYVAARGIDLLRQLDEPERFPVAWLLQGLNDSSPGKTASGARGGCLEYTYDVAGGPAPSQDFDALVLRMPTIFVGTVVASGDGLAAGSPQTMLLASVERWIRRADAMPDATEVYLRYPSPRVEVAGLSVCRPGDQLPGAPSNGTTVLAMIYGAPGYYVEDTPVVYTDTLLYDGVQEGVPTLMASDRVLLDSPDWVLDATVEELTRRAAQVWASPDDFRERRETGAAKPEPGEPGVDTPKAGTPQATDEAGQCLYTEECLVTPLVLTRDVFGPYTSDLNFSVTAFDLDADGRPEHTAWLIGANGDAFLWMDLNHNGRVDGAHEFVGAPGTDPREPPAAINSSFEILRLYDQPLNGGNGDGKIDRSDGVWDRLLLWNDINDDGISDPGEVYPVEAQVVYFDIEYELTDEWDGSLNRIVGRGRYWFRGPRRDLRARDVVELALRFD